MSASPEKLKKFKTVENVVKWAGVALAVAAGVLIYFQWKSVWLAVFGFICVAKFFGGELPHVIYHPKRLRRIAFYLSFTIYATVILYFTYHWWNRMWLSVILGLVLGFILNVLTSGLFKVNEIYEEDQKKSLDENKYDAEMLMKNNPDAVAMKDRFSDTEWQEIKTLPQLMTGLIMKVPVKQKDGSYKLELRVSYNPLMDPEEFSNPLLRMMIIENKIEFSTLFAQNQYNPIAMKQIMGDIGNSEAVATILKGGTPEKPESMTIIENTLNPEEYRSFVRSLLEFTLKSANVKGEKLNPALLQIIFQYFATFAGSEQDLRAMIDGVSLK